MISPCEMTINHSYLRLKILPMLFPLFVWCRIRRQLISMTLHSYLFSYFSLYSISATTIHCPLSPRLKQTVITTTYNTNVQFPAYITNTLIKIDLVLIKIYCTVKLFVTHWTFKLINKLVPQSLLIDLHRKKGSLNWIMLWFSRQPSLTDLWLARRMHFTGNFHKTRGNLRYFPGSHCTIVEIGMPRWLGWIVGHVHGHGYDKPSTTKYIAQVTLTKYFVWLLRHTPNKDFFIFQILYEIDGDNNQTWCTQSDWTAPLIMRPLSRPRLQHKGYP